MMLLLMLLMMLKFFVKESSSLIVLEILGLQGFSLIPVWVSAPPISQKVIRSLPTPPLSPPNSYIHQVLTLLLLEVGDCFSTPLIFWKSLL